VPNKENIRKWVDALRSGDYQQAQGALRHDGADQDGYCCLGVACDISGLGRWVMVPEDDEYDFGPSARAYQVGEEYSTGVLPRSVAEWLGVSDGNPDVNYDPEGPYTLAGLNDGQRLSFEQIADVIEREWLSEEETA
jgi:hypothetical protein